MVLVVCSGVGGVLLPEAVLSCTVVYFSLGWSVTF